MFNLKQARAKAQSKDVSPFEKALKKNRESLSNVADDDPSVSEGQLDDVRSKMPPETITDDQLTHSASGDEQIAEKKMKRKKHFVHLTNNDK